MLPWPILSFHPVEATYLHNKNHKFNFDPSFHLVHKMDFFSRLMARTVCAVWDFFGFAQHFFIDTSTKYLGLNWLEHTRQRNSKKLPPQPPQLLKETWTTIIFPNKFIYLFVPLKRTHAYGFQKVILKTNSMLAARNK